MGRDESSEVSEIEGLVMREHQSRDVNDLVMQEHESRDVNDRMTQNGTSQQAPHIAAGSDAAGGTNVQSPAMSLRFKGLTAFTGFCSGIFGSIFGIGGHQS